MAIPHRGWTSTSTYFVTASTCDKKRLLQSEKNASLFIEVLYHHREQGKYLLHEFVVMPNHFHLLITPQETLERALQVVKGGFSFRVKREFGYSGEIWQSSYYDRRVRNVVEYQSMKQYIRENPVRAKLVGQADEFPFSSANLSFELDEVPQRLKPLSFGAAGPQG